MSANIVFFKYSVLLSLMLFVIGFDVLIIHFYLEHFVDFFCAWPMLEKEQRRKINTAWLCDNKTHRMLFRIAATLFRMSAFVTQLYVEKLLEPLLQI